MTGKIWPEIELVQDFMSVLVTCKCDEDPIKNEGNIHITQYFLHYKYLEKSCCSRASNSKANSLSQNRTCPRFYVFPRYLQVEDRSKMKAVSCSHFFMHSRASNSKVTGWFWPEFELVRNFISVLVTCERDEDPIKNEDTICSSCSH